MNAAQRPFRRALILGTAAALGAIVGACTTSFKLETAHCNNLCTTARTCGVIPSSLAGSADASDGEIYEQCVRRCESSSSARADIKALIECLDLYMVAGDANVCAGGCDDVRRCMQDAVSFGDIGEAALGKATVTVTMVPASFWMSTVEAEIWCPSDGETVPALAAYYDREETALEAQQLLLLTQSGFNALITALNEAADADARVLALAKVESDVQDGKILLPSDLIPELRRELAADGWAALGIDNGDLTPGGCIRSRINGLRNRIFGDVDPSSLESVSARLSREVSGGQAVQIFDGGFLLCKQNESYLQSVDEEIGEISAETTTSGGDEPSELLDTDGPIVGGATHFLCQRTVGMKNEACQRWGKPLCRDIDCDGGLAGCDPLECYFDGLPPSRACSELGITEIYLGYESDNTQFLSPDPLGCDGKTVSATFPDVTIGLVTPIAVVHGRRSGAGIPGDAQLFCGILDDDEAAPEGPEGAPRAAGSIFADPDPGDYCWVIRGERTMLRAGDSPLIVPSPYVEYLKEAIKPAVRLGLVGVRPPVGCKCELVPSQCEEFSRGNCRDGADNDANGVADYYEPECARFYSTTPFYGPQGGSDEVAGACETTTGQ